MDAINIYKTKIMNKFKYYLRAQILILSLIFGVNVNSCKFKSKSNDSSGSKKAKNDSGNDKLKNKIDENEKDTKEPQTIKPANKNQNQNNNNNNNIQIPQNNAGNETEGYGEEEDESIDETEKDETEEEDDDSEEGREMDTIYSTTSSAKLGFVDEESKISLPKHMEGQTVPTVSLTFEGPDLLPSEYANVNHKDFETDVRELKKSARKQMKKNLRSLKGELYDCSRSGKNHGMNPLRFKVRICKFKKQKWGLGHVFDFRKAAKERKRSTRATLAYTRSTGECKNYESLILLNILRERSEDEDKIRRLLRKLITLGKANGNDPKKAHLCANDGIKAFSSIRKMPIKREEDEDVQTRITSDNTKLELIKISIVRRTIGRADTFKIENGMQEMDENTVLCYNTEIKDERKKIKRKNNEKVYYKVIAKYDWIGPLNSIPEADYVLEGKRKSSWKKIISNKVEKEISPKIMVFASKDVPKKDLFRNYKTIESSDLENDPKPVAETILAWRLELGGIPVGLIPAAESYIDLGSEDWGKKGGIMGRIQKLKGKIVRGISRLLNKMEISTPAYE